MFPARCPNCYSPSVRLTAPVGPTLQAFRCNDCGVGWNVLVAGAAGPDPTAPRGCPTCGSSEISFVDHTPTAILWRCFDCDTTFTVSLKTTPASTG
jgi:transposase-like protein